MLLIRVYVSLRLYRRCSRFAYVCFRYVEVWRGCKRSNDTIFDDVFEIEIFGDWTRGIEVIGLDNVIIIYPDNYLTVRVLVPFFLTRRFIVFLCLEPFIINFRILSF